MMMMLAFPCIAVDIVDGVGCWQFKRGSDHVIYDQR